MVKHENVCLYVDRMNRQWVVRDSHGNFWILPQTESPWLDRQPYEPSEECELEPVPGHYKRMLGLSF